MLGAVEFAHEQIQPVIDLIIDLAEDAAKEPFDFSAPDYSGLSKAVAKAGEKQMLERIKTLTKAYPISELQNSTYFYFAAGLTNEP